MIKTPLQVVADNFKDQVQRDRDRTSFIHAQTDNFVTWLIGFSFTGLILIISNLKDFNEQFSISLKPIVASLLAVIVFGIDFRFISF